MESPNLHQLQDQDVASPHLPFYGVSTHSSSSSPWTPNSFLTHTDHNFNPNLNDQILTRPPSQKVQDYMNFHSQWPPPTNNNIEEEGFSHQQQLGSDHAHLPKIKEELSAANARAVQEGNLSLYYPNAHHHCCSFDETVVGMAADSGSFGGQSVLPSINISNGRHRETLRNLEMNMEALDLLTTARFGDSDRRNLSMFKHNESAFGIDLRPTHQPLNSPKMFSSEARDATKRGSSSLMEPQASQTAANKRLRSDPRSPCPPLKVRKEKLGDRISALQQLVAPFGKTDTASVLMEAIQYIKFLQSQVASLSVPYMKTVRNRMMASRKTRESAHHRGSAVAGERNETGEEDEGRRDLRSRGLCLVPLSCMSYITTSPTDSTWLPQTLAFTTTHAAP